jgi:hypothetical protein
MRQRYIVYHNGRAIGWVHAHNPMEAIQRVAAITGKPVNECAALLWPVQLPAARGPAHAAGPR